ncbi:furin-like protease 2 [Anthonomus grandis grandis]|uniref:furin-like protease 2 n=1 Tax=Anthonomus grandis grandis TaxID=2921223 RepID=UPI00216539D8|nr:furin-like protease 2 [Anthonomus grandis grandis]XP_050300646.1 furin-like protease 2 [Anthonomus grandis grandis]XP_050300654.1 furin-like protease 2 [Anthonomus grandis grandis]XP_050300662.1 furin-like protease 2 [Anthonomus grandis grandis]
MVSISLLFKNHLQTFSLLAFASVLIVIKLVPSVHALRDSPVFLNEFAVHIPEGDATADVMAEKHGFINKGQIGSLKGFYLFEHQRIRKRSVKANDDIHKTLQSEPQILWVQQQHEKKRKKRDYVSSTPSPSIFSQYFTGVAPEAQSHGQPHYRAVPDVAFPDPLYREQWYLNGGAKDGLDMNVAPAWQKGYTGKGIVVSILDDGIQTNHPDLLQNYDAQASTDINGNDDDPMPQDNGDNKHGTRCAGEVAAVAYNNICGIGVAYNASIGGVRMLDGVVNDAVEAKALGLNPEHIDIYSASWGPEDDGKTVDGPGPLARRAFIYGVTSGRKGKGSIFVWASGNGGRHTDSCNCDGYTNSIFTLSISSATQGGFKPWYLEECSSTLATTYSSGTPGHDKSVATVDMDARLRQDHICTVEHTGTSASAPLAAGICALALEANPSLTWRDMQYLVVLTSRAEPLEKENGWIVNGVKRKISHKFGYGLMDAGALVGLAERWTTVPPQHICKSQEVIEDKTIPHTYGATLDFYMDVDACSNSLNEVKFLEHVQCKISLRFFPRGNLRILLTSPMGTVSTLLFERPRDVVSSNFDDWPFLSVHYWGEKAEGRWRLQIINAGSRHVSQVGILKKWQLVFYGTNVNPVRLRSPNGIRSSPWKAPVSSFVFPTQPQPVTPVTDNFFDPSDVFNNFPHVYSFSGSELSPEVSSLNEKNVKVSRENRNMEFDEETKDGCDDQCDDQGCFGKGPTKCIACRFKRMDNACVSACPPRSYSDQGVCKPCHEACETCTGPDQKSCVTCAPGHVRVLDLDICLQQCPENYFENFADRTCISCHANCAGCENRPDHCTSCDHHLLLYQNKCLASCPPNTFETNDYRCAPCDESCETCIGGNSSQCVKCPAGKYWNEGRCVSECPAHHFSDFNQRECVECPPGCSECNASTCISCLDDWKVNLKGRCQTQSSNKCDVDQYYDNGICKQCHSTCDTCDGPTERACLSCASPLILHGTKCVGACENGFYHEKETQICEPCLHTCAKCVAKMNCTDCITGLQLQSGECHTTCAQGYYSDKGLCMRCYMSCKTCSGPGPDQCVSCPDSWLLLNGECRPDCPAGYYKTEYGCQKCHYSCANCPECKVQEDKRKINVQALLLSAQPVSSLQLVNPFNFVTGLAVIACLCIIILFVVVFLVLQRTSSQVNQRGFSRVSIRKPKVTCNYNVVAVSDGDSSDSEASDLIKNKPKPENKTTC